MNSKDDEKKLHPKILELLEEIKKSQEINREDKEILDIHKFRIKCYEIEKLILEAGRDDLPVFSVAHRLAHRLKLDNPAFERARFMAACGFPVGE